MTWNYRLFKQEGSTKVFDIHGKNLPVPPIYFVAECYYDDDGKPEMHSTMEHNLLAGDNVAETKKTYKMIAEAFKAPVIELNEEGEFING